MADPPVDQDAMADAWAAEAGGDAAAENKDAAMADAWAAATEMEALHRLSAFCLHDLKNLAAKLSMVVFYTNLVPNRSSVL